MLLLRLYTYVIIMTIPSQSETCVEGLIGISFNISIKNYKWHVYEECLIKKLCVFIKQINIKI